MEDIVRRERGRETGDGTACPREPPASPVPSLSARLSEAWCPTTSPGPALSTGAASGLNVRKVVGTSFVFLSRAASAAQ